METVKLICIGCPMGCDLSVDIDNGVPVSVTGNTCPIGKKYAEEEVTAPKRTVTSTALSEDGVPVPVKTAGTVPKSAIFAVVGDIKAARPTLPVKIGDVIVKDAAGCGVPVVATKDVSG